MNILEEANEIIFKRSEEKQRQYGPIDESIAKAARVATELCGKKITTADFYKCLIALKISRMAYNVKYDTMLDCIGYIAAYENFENNEK